LEELEKTMEFFNDEKSHVILNQWSKKSSTIGRTVSVTTQSGKTTGKAIKLDKDGGLIIKQNSKLVKVTSGDVIHQ
jgi:BirA family biotin operon repressor/biotin-[acetyl-CoA-carboxylase] ligase